MQAEPPTSTPETSPNPAILILLFVACTLVAGALLAPALFSFGQFAARTIEEFRLGATAPFGYLHKVASESGFHRYFNRAILVSALVLLWPFARLMRLRRSDFALGKNRAWILDLGVGFLLAAGILLALGVILLGTGYFESRSDPAWGKAATRAIGTAAGVSLMEEFVFRGALFALLLRTLRPMPALLMLSAIFAAVHFLKPPESAALEASAVTWSSGFWLVGQIFRHFGDPTFLLAEFATLFAVGIVLADARLKTRSLWVPIGLHAGWVFGIFFYRGFASAASATKAGDHLPWIGENLKTGIFPLIAIAVTAALLRPWLLHRQRQSLPEPP